MANLPIPPMKYMPNPLYTVPTWNEDGDAVYMIVEINHGTITKYELISETGMLKVDRVGYSHLAYPFEYGAVPGTLDEDGDALDIILYGVTEKLVPGCLVEVRPVGLAEMIDGGEVDDKVIGVLKDDKRFDHIKDLSDLNEYFLKETTYYFEHYKDMKKPGTVQIKGFKDKKGAIEIIKKCQDRYEKELKPKIQ